MRAGQVEVVKQRKSIIGAQLDRNGGIPRRCAPRRAIVRSDQRVMLFERGHQRRPTGAITHHPCEHQKRGAGSR